jgi:hypothetical protein
VQVFLSVCTPVTRCSGRDVTKFTPMAGEIDELMPPLGPVSDRDLIAT